MQKKKFDITKILAIVSFIICLVGGILVMNTYSEAGWGGFGAIPFGLFIIVGVLIGLKFQRVGSLLCLSMGVIAPLTSFLGTCVVEQHGPAWSLMPCIIASLIYQLGIIFAISGGVVGLIGGILRSRKQKGNLEEREMEEKEKSQISEQKDETLYLIQIEKEREESGKEKAIFIYGNCKSKNTLEVLNKTIGKYRCLHCGAKNYLKQ